MHNTAPYTNGSAPVDVTSDSEMDILLRELAALRAENRQLRNRLPKTHRYSQRVRKAVADAHTLLLAAFSGEGTGISSSRTQGTMKRAAWSWAVAVLRYAGIVADGNRQWRKGLRWLVEDLDTAVLLLETAGRELDGPEGYARLVELRRK